MERPQFQTLLGTLREGDTLVVTKLDRFARSTKDALETIERFKVEGVRLVVLNWGGMTVDTSTPVGKFMATLFAGFAEFEAD